MRLWRLRVIVWQVNMRESLNDYRRHNIDCGTAACILKFRKHGAANYVRDLEFCEHDGAFLGLITCEYSQPIENNARRSCIHRTLITAPFRMSCDNPKDCFRNSAAIRVPVVQAFAAAWLYQRLWALFNQKINHLDPKSLLPNPYRMIFFQIAETTHVQQNT